MDTPRAGDIEEAKMRVREMQQRANGFVASARANDKNPGEGRKTEAEQDNKSTYKNNPLSAALGGNSDESIILMLLILLSKEGADSTLLMALLYLLL